MPRAASARSVITVVVVYAAVATAAVSAFPAHRDPSRAGRVLERALDHLAGRPDPGAGARRSAAHFPHPVRRRPAGAGRPDRDAILLLAIATSFSGCARMTESMGEHLQLPAIFGRRSRRIAAAARRDSPRSACCPAGSIVVASFFQGEEIADAGVALQLRHPARASLSAGLDHLAADHRARHAARVHDARQRPHPRQADPADVGRRRARCRSRRGSSRSAPTPGRAIVGPLWMVGGLADLRGGARARRAAAAGAGRAWPRRRPTTVTDLPHGPIVVPLERLDAIGEEMMATALRLALEHGLGRGRGERDRGPGARPAGRAAARARAARSPRCRPPPSRWPRSTA